MKLPEEQWRELLAERRRLVGLIRAASQALRTGKLDSFECVVNMGRRWRARGQRQAVLSPMVRGTIVQRLGKLPVLWVRIEETAFTLALLQLRLIAVEGRLRVLRGLTRGAWEHWMLSIETPCERCQVRYFGGMRAHLLAVMQRLGEDPSTPETWEALDCASGVEENLRESGDITPRDYAMARGA